MAYKKKKDRNPREQYHGLIKHLKDLFTGLKDPFRRKASRKIQAILIAHTGMTEFVNSAAPMLMLEELDERLTAGNTSKYDWEVAVSRLRAARSVIRVLEYTNDSYHILPRFRKKRRRPRKRAGIGTVADSPQDNHHTRDAEVCLIPA